LLTLEEQLTRPPILPTRNADRMDQCFTVKIRRSKINRPSSSLGQSRNPSFSFVFPYQEIKRDMSAQDGRPRGSGWL